jgi:hypothetical protein
MASVIEQRRVFLRSRKKPSRENEMLAEKLDSFATLALLQRTGREL